MSPHVKRWITGVIGVVLLLGVIIYGSEAVFSGVIVLIIAVAVLEYHRMMLGQEALWEKFEILIAALLIAAAFIADDARLILATLTFSVLAVFFIYLLRIRDADFGVVAVAKVAFGILYIPLTIGHFILVRRSDQGILWIFFILVLAFAGDIAAFYVGRTWGRRKLLPLVSPGKTEEGILGLVAGSVIGCLVFRQLFLPSLPIVHTVALGIAGSVIGQLGDLCESAIKRASGVKDSGAILPGHGGLLDRLDCLIFIVPFVYYYRIFVIS
ncbi:MAG: phosphatidate cytidylyltransferase [Deltaproteobacteria bacterium]|nr:phosphatidate cytidylyltransferase [Deltaproteobacteria bacterium]